MAPSYMPGRRLAVAGVTLGVLLVLAVLAQVSLFQRSDPAPGSPTAVVTVPPTATATATVSPTAAVPSATPGPGATATATPAAATATPAAATATLLAGLPTVTPLPATATPRPGLPTVTARPTNTPSPTGTATPGATPTVSPTPTPQPTSTVAPPSATPERPTETSVPPTATAPAPTPTAVPPTATPMPPTSTPRPSATQTALPPTATQTVPPPTATATATATATPTPTGTPSSTATSSPTPSPTASPSASPTTTPLPLQTLAPTQTAPSPTPQPVATITPAESSPTPGGGSPTPAGAATATPAATQTAPAAGTGTPDTTRAEEPPATSAWLVASTAHFGFHYLPCSPAARDVERLKELAERSLREVAAQLQTAPAAHVDIYFVNRIFWQGGAAYTGDELLLSYTEPDRDYTSGDLATVLRHEIAHALVEQMAGGENKGGLLGEGAAVWASGGHYRREPVEALAATLVGENRDLYRPLEELQRDFHAAQHEISYIQAGAFVKYLVQTHGLERFKEALDRPREPLQVYDRSLAVLEADWRAWLARLPRTAADARAVKLRVRYFDLMRRYQTELDPPARLLPNKKPSEWGQSLVDQFSRPAEAPRNVELERAFVSAGEALWAGELDGCERLLDRIQRDLS